MRRLRIKFAYPCQESCCHCHADSGAGGHLTIPSWQHAWWLTLQDPCASILLKESDHEGRHQTVRVTPRWWQQPTVSPAAQSRGHARMAPKAMPSMAGEIGRQC